MTFKPATRSGTKAFIGLYGGSGSGKTYSALLLARGLVGPKGNVFMIDTESRRGEMYFDQIEGGYLVKQMTEPFSSAKYGDYIMEANADAGDVETCLIIDSFSHEWEGVGGVCSAAETISENRAKKYGKEWNGAVQFGDWKTPKGDHKHMMLQMLGCKMHIICCLRAQYKSRQIEKKDYEKFGIKSNMNSTVIRDEYQSPIQDQNFIYEMTINAELRNERPGVPILTKCPEMLRHAFEQGKQISGETGKLIGEWTAGGSPQDDIMAGAIDESIGAAANGTETYKKWFTDQNTSVKTFLTQSGEHAHRKTEAEAADHAHAAPEGSQEEEPAFNDDGFPGDPDYAPNHQY